MQDFRNLDVWHKAHALAIDVHKTLHRNKRVDAHLRSQLSRAARSIPSNLVEGCGTNSQAELARFAGMSVSSSSETEYWVLFGKDLGYFPIADFERLTSAVIEVRRMLFGFRKAIRNGGKAAPSDNLDHPIPASTPPNSSPEDQEVLSTPPSGLGF
jgi:four helix bundle protein